MRLLKAPNWEVDSNTIEMWKFSPGLGRLKQHRIVLAKKLQGQYFPPFYYMFEMIAIFVAPKTRRH